MSTYYRKLEPGEPPQKGDFRWTWRDGENHWFRPVEFVEAPPPAPVHRVDAGYEAFAFVRRYVTVIGAKEEAYGVNNGPLSIHADAKHRLKEARRILAMLKD